MFDWKFSCEDHGFKQGSLHGWLYALSILGMQEGADEDQIIKAVQKVTMHYQMNKKS